MAGAMSQIWGMINGMQVFVHFPLFNTEIPPGPMEIIKSIIAVAVFDLPLINFADLFELTLGED